MYNKIINRITPLGFTWETNNPFLFCVHHKDRYPPGNEELGPAASLEGRMLGQDFTRKDGWRMYHGDKIPGFPAHPHRGFETVTVVLNGYVDHSDSHGASGRYGNGDVQWMTAGSGLQHAEMFPLLNRDKENPLELFQIWLNLPKDKKFVKPHYDMLWSEDIPVRRESDAQGRSIEVTVIAGKLHDTDALEPAPDSWAHNTHNDVGIWLIKLAAHAQWIIPPAFDGIMRSLYFYQGKSLTAAGVNIPSYHSADLMADQPVILQNGDKTSNLLLLQGRPIDEPVVQYGPFVMNNEDEIRQAYSDYHNNHFGGWPWPRQDNVHPRNKGRFARYSDGREDIRDK